MKTSFKFQGIDNNHNITKESDSDFLLLIQHAALLGLKDTGFLNEMQCRQAEEMLHRQYRDYIKTAQTEAGEYD